MNTDSAFKKIICIQHVVDKLNVLKTSVSKLEKFSYVTGTCKRSNENEIISSSKSVHLLFLGQDFQLGSSAIATNPFETKFKDETS